VGKFVKFTDLDQGMDGSFTPANAFSGLTPSMNLKNQVTLLSAI